MPSPLLHRKCHLGGCDSSEYCERQSEVSKEGDVVRPSLLPGVVRCVYEFLEGGKELPRLKWVFVRNEWFFLVSTVSRLWKEMPKLRHGFLISSFSQSN